jgi:serine-type D-Ala-D-Ala carboxypeptidase/endopeptidase (penicillin-binding protein 4)
MNRFAGRRGNSAVILLLTYVFFSVTPPFEASPPRLIPLQQSPTSGRSRSLRQRILAVLDSRPARDAQWGIQVISLRRGESLFSWNADKLFVPASTAKLFTTAATLVRLGPDFQYHTSVEISGPIDERGALHGDLILVGRGDPNLSGRVLPYNGRTERSSEPMKVFEDLAADVSASGVRAVDGDLVADDTYFVNQPYGEGWTVGDMVWGYGAPVSALSSNDNVITFTILPGRRAGDRATVEQGPMDRYFDVTNRVVTISGRRGPSSEGGARAERRIAFDRRPGSRILSIWGQIPEGDPGLTESVAVDEPSRFAGEFFRLELLRRGIQIKGSLKVRHLEPMDVPDLRGVPQTPAASSAKVIASHQSHPLVESLKVIEKVSQNLHAEMLLRTLGRERRHVGSVEAGLEEVNQFLREMGVNESDAALRDGSGLSRQSLVSPLAAVTLLKSMYNSPYRSSWIDLLPVAGEDGSMKERLQDSAVQGRIHAKTGSLAGVAALVGYFIAENKEPLAFAIFLNNGNLPEAASHALIDRVAREIARGH